MPDTIYVPCGVGEGQQLKSQLSTKFQTVIGSENKGFACMRPKQSLEATINWLRMHYTSYKFNGQWWQRPSEEESEW